jgi:uncharacterized protein
MELTWPHFLLVFIGIVTGTLTGLTGASGMSVLISGLLLIGTPIREVIGLSFVVTMANSTMAAIPYGRKGNIPFLPATVMSVAAGAAVFGGYRFSFTLPPGSLSWVIIFGLGAAGVKLTYFNRERSARSEERLQKRSPWLLIIPGAIIGFVMGILGGGGGLFISLVLLFIFRMPTHHALGISLIVMAVAAIPGITLYGQGGFIPLASAIIIILPSTICSFVAARIANKLSDALIKRLLGIYLHIMTVLLILKNLNLIF